MAAFVKSVEEVTTTFNPSDIGEHQQTVNLSKSQAIGKCLAFPTFRFTNDNQADMRNANAVGCEFIDNAGTPAVRIHWNVGTDSTPGDIEVYVQVVEMGAAVTVQQGSVSLTGTSITDTISAVTQGNAFIAFTQAGIGISQSDDWNDTLIQARFVNDTTISFERRAGGAPDWTIYYYVIESNGTDFNTEYVEYTFANSETGPTDLTLSNSITLANAFVITTGEVAHGSDDLKQSIWNVHLTGPATLTWCRDHGSTTTNGGTIGVWVVRASSSEFSVQRFETNADGQTTTNQTITAVDLSRAVPINSQNVACCGWAPENATNGADVNRHQHSMRLTSTTNIQHQRLQDTALAGTNNMLRYEIVEFELEAGGEVIIAEPGAFTWTGTDASLERGIILDADPGAFAWTGTDANLNKGSTLSVEPGSFAWIGTDAALLVGRAIIAESGAFDWTGTDADFLLGRVIEAESGAFVWTGTDAKLCRGLLVDAESGEFAWTGTPAGLRPPNNQGIVADPGAFDWTGTDVRFGQNHVIEAESGMFMMAGTDAELYKGTKPKTQPAGLPTERRKPKSKYQRFILPDNRVFTDPDRALFELHKLLAQNKAPEPTETDGEAESSVNLEDVRVAAPLPQASSSAPPPGPGLMQNIAEELPRMIAEASIPAENIDPQLISVLLQRIDDEEAALLLL